MNCLFSRSWKLAVVQYVNKRSKMHFANCAALAAVLFTTLTENLRFCYSAKTGLFLICS